MSAEVDILITVGRLVATALPWIVEAARSEPEEAVIAKLHALASPMPGDTTAEDAARRERLAGIAAALSRVSVADVDVVRRYAASVAVTGEERAALLRLAAHVEHGLRVERADEPTVETAVETR